VQRGVGIGMTVAQCVQGGERDWDTDKLVQAGGQGLAELVRNIVPVPQRDRGMEGRLIWTPARNGQYVVKLGYQMLRDRGGTQRERSAIWKIIWGLRKVLPKVKMFLWRACQGGLATAVEMHRRIHRIPATCARCQQENEYVMHSYSSAPAHEPYGLHLTWHCRWTGCH
jgi:zinc-binding in reverse transcriptase